jgi:hypothetical protein
MGRDWQEAYRVAVMETDQQKLADKIDSACAVLQDCLQEFGSAHEHGSGERQKDEQQNARERQQIINALRTLDLIRRTELNIPA